MTTGSQGAALRQLRTLLDRGAVGQLSDAELIERFLSDRDTNADAAFAALVERHGPAVFRVCRSVLRDAEAAHDAFQATFLVLVRKAGSVRVRDSIGPWLVAVAYRTASGARSAANRRRAVERDATQLRTSREPSDEDLAQEVRAEVDRLADRYRRPILLCYFAGLTHEGAARQLGCPVGTVRSRLAWGRKQLRERLMRRGLVPAVALGPLAATPTRASVPSALLIRTARAASRSGMREAVSAGAIVQAERVVRAMFMTKLKGIAAALLTLALVATGGGVLAQQQQDNPGPRPAAERPFRPMDLDDVTFELTTLYQKLAPPKVRPDVELEMLLRTAREQEQAGHLDQALALTARMETALQEWQAKLHPPTAETTIDAPQNYIKRIAVMPGEAVPPAKGQPDRPWSAEELRKLPADEARRKLTQADAQRAATPFPEPTPLDPPAEGPVAKASQGSPANPATRPPAANDDRPDRPLLTLEDAQQAAARLQKGNSARSMKWTRAQLAAELERKVPLAVRCNAGIVAAIKTIQRAYTGPDGPVPIFFDLNGPGKANASLLKDVYLNVEDVPLRTALRTVLDQAGLTYRVEEGRIVIVEVTTDPTPSQKP